MKKIRKSLGILLVFTFLFSIILPLHHLVFAQQNSDEIEQMVEVGDGSDNGSQLTSEENNDEALNEEASTTEGEQVEDAKLAEQEAAPAEEVDDKKETEVEATLEVAEESTPEPQKATNAKEIYLDGAKGSDDNDGLTPETAFKTFEKAKAVATESQSVEKNYCDRNR